MDGRHAQVFLASRRWAGSGLTSLSSWEAWAHASPLMPESGPHTAPQIYVLLCVMGWVVVSSVHETFPVSFQTLPLGSHVTDFAHHMWEEVGVLLLGKYFQSQSPLSQVTHPELYWEPLSSSCEMLSLFYDQLIFITISFLISKTCHPLSSQIHICLLGINPTNWQICILSSNLPSERTQEFTAATVNLTCQLDWVGRRVPR